MSSINKLLIAASALNDITKNTVKDFIKTGLDENYTVELKTYHKASADNDKHKIRKSISSFANLQGGFLLVGVKDKKNSKNKNSVDERVVGLVLTEEPQKWVDDICSQSTVLPRPSYTTALVKINTTKSILVIKVQPYVLGPVAIKKKSSDMLEFWSRGNGSDVAMDYIALQNKYDSKAASMVKRAFIDLSETLTDILELQKHPIQVNSYDPMRLNSSLVDDRIFYYEALGYSEKIMLGIKNLRKAITVYNTCVDIRNKTHLEGGTVNDAGNMAQAMNNYLELAGGEIINIAVELHRQFPDEGAMYFSYLQKLAKEHDEAIKKS
jgi:hypothetical protein